MRDLFLDLSHGADLARHLAQLMPDAEGLILPGVAHLPSLEGPEALARLIRDFLDRKADRP